MSITALKHLPGKPIRRGGAGFTLIELMVTILIIAILAGIAVPTYMSSVRKSRRTEAKTAIMDLAAREERYFATQNQYTNDPVLLQYAAGGSGAAWPIPVGSYYSIIATNATLPVAPTATTPGSPGTYTLQVAPSVGSVQLQDSSCQTFQVDQTGKQSSLDSGGSDSSTVCWP